MTIDTSAVVAILFGEPAAEIFAEAIEGAAVRLISVASVLEAAIVVESELGDPGAPEKDAKVFTPRCSYPLPPRAVIDILAAQDV
jgi:uncharacterized protein with PIN domain